MTAPRGQGTFVRGFWRQTSNQPEDVGKVGILVSWELNGKTILLEERQMDTVILDLLLTVWVTLDQPVRSRPSSSWGGTKGLEQINGQLQGTAAAACLEMQVSSTGTLSGVLLGLTQHRLHSRDPRSSRGDPVYNAEMRGSPLFLHRALK